MFSKYGRFIKIAIVSAQSLTVVRLSQLNAGDLFSFAMWTLQSCAITPSGGRTSLLVAPSQYGDLIFGAEIPTGQAVAFTLPQCFESEFITLYDVIRTNEKVGDAILLQLDDLSTWYPSNPKSDKDLQFAHDVCSGLGGFSTAFSYLGGSILCAVDSCPLACDAYSRIFSAPCICSDIGSMSTIRSMHDLQHAQHCQAMMFAGFPCQPLSQQGAQLRAGLDGFLQSLWLQSLSDRSALALSLAFQAFPLVRSLLTGVVWNLSDLGFPSPCSFSCHQGCHRGVAVMEPRRRRTIGMDSS